jgi:hydroxybutyrate-dimer hydrolase
MSRRTTISSIVLLTFGLCSAANSATPPAFIKGPISIKTYDGVSDDLLTASLGKTGLAGAAPGYSNPADPTAAELRKNAIYNNYRALVDMTPGGGYGVLYGPNIDLDGNNTLGEGKITGTEYIAYSDDGTGKKNITLMVQVPNSFSNLNPCIITGTSSGSRGIYGAIATSGDWGLKKGCAVAYADKGSGMGAHDIQNNTVNLIDGTRTTADIAGTASNFTTDLTYSERAAFNAATPNRFAFKHAHSKQNPEKDWGQHTLQAVQFALWALNENHKQGGTGYTAANTIVIASSVSNGGGAAIRAAEQDSTGLIDGVAVSEPNTQPFPNGAFSIKQGTKPAVTYPNHSRALFDYTTLVNLYQLCASLAASNSSAPLNGVITAPGSTVDLRPNRCLSLKEKGLLTASDLAGQATEAQQKINAAAILVEQNLLQPFHYSANVPQSISVTYANAYGRFSVKDTLCGFSYGATDGTGNPTPAPVNDVEQIFALGNGIPPTADINLIYDPSVGGPKHERAAISPSTNRQDIALDGALCLHALATGKDPVTGTMYNYYSRIQTGINEARSLGTLTKPTIIVHGRNDTVIAPNHTSRAYFGLNKITQGSYSKTHYIEVKNAHHLDAFNAFAGFDTRLVPLHVYFNQALNLMYNHLKTGSALPPSQVVRTVPRGGTPGAAPAITTANVPPIKMAPPSTDLITFSSSVVTIPE